MSFVGGPKYGGAARGARRVDHEPLVDAVLVKMVLAGQHAQVLVGFVVVQADAAGRVLVREHVRRKLFRLQPVDGLFSSRNKTKVVSDCQ